jgi:probable O-glycosylation ligase (exosortase A-associated)
MHGLPAAISRSQQMGLASVVCGLLALAWYWLPDPRLVVLLAVLPLAALTALRLPFLLVLLFIVFSFFRLHEVLPWLNPLRLPQLLAGATLAVLAWHVLLSRRIQPYWSVELSWLNGFFVLVTIGVPLASNMGEALSRWTSVYVKIYVMTLATCWLLRRPQDFSLASRLFALSGIVVATAAISNKLQGLGLVEETRVTVGRELGSVLGDPNDLALVLLFPASIALGLTLRRGLPRWERGLGLITYALVLLAVIYTQSRGGLLGVLAVSGVFAWRRVRNKVLLVSVGGLLMVLLSVVAGLSGRASGGAAEGGVDESAMGRLYAWQAAWGMALDHPFKGVGLNNFYFNYYYYSPHWDGLNHAVHSTWFGVLAETGFIGLAVFLALVLVTLRRAWKMCKSPLFACAPAAVAAAMESATAGLVGFVVSGTFLTQGFTWPLYLQTALAVAAMRLLQETASQNAMAPVSAGAKPRF